MVYDYLVVGAGLAGISFIEIALQNGKTVFVINDASQNSSIVAAGLYNPVILKRFTPVWNANEQLLLLNSFYKTLEKKFNARFDYKMPLLRKFHSIEEQNNWFVACDNKQLSSFLSTELLDFKNDSIKSDFHFGEVNLTGFVDTKLLITSYHHYLSVKNVLLNASFKYNQILFEKDCFVYNNIKAKHLVFTEGFGMQFNPYFCYLPLDGAKGELLVIKSANLNLDVIIKTNIFIIPLGNDFYRVGATYNWTDKTNIPTQEAKNELINELDKLIDCDYEIISHQAGVRPTVKDRKPMLGSHPFHQNMYVLNGLGTRGVMLAPAMAKMLFEHIEYKKELDSYVDIKRFKKHYSNFES